MTKILNTIVGILQWAIYFVIIYYAGWIKGIISIYIAYTLLDLLLWRLFNIRIMKGVDLIMYLEEVNNASIWVWALILDKHSKDLKDMGGEDHFSYIKNNVILKHFGGRNEVFRSTVLEVFGMKFWKVLPDTKETKAFCGRKVKKVEHEIKNENDITQYLKDISTMPMPKDDLQWDFHICDNYQDDKVVLFGRVHHGMCDGMGLMMLLSSIDGNKNLSAIPQMKDISTFNKIVFTILFPLSFLYWMYLDLLLKNDENPYKLKNGFSGKKAYVVSKKYDFVQLR